MVSAVGTFLCCVEGDVNGWSTSDWGYVFGVQSPFFLVVEKAGNSSRK